MGEALVIVSNGFGTVSGPSIALFHTLRGLSKFFDEIYLLNTIRYTSSYDKAMLSYLPKNVNIIDFMLHERPYTLVFLKESSQRKLFLGFREAMKRLRALVRGETYLLVMSDIFNLKSLSTCSDDRYYVGYNVFFNFAPPDVMLRQKVKHVNPWETGEKIYKLLLSEAYRRIDLGVVKHVGHILAHTNYQRMFYNNYLGISDKNITVIPHMIDVSLVQGLGHQGRIAPEGGSRIFFFSGRRTIEKGSYVLVRAFKKFSDRCRCDARLVLVGDPPVCRELREVKEKLIFVRQRPYPDYLRLMSSVDVVLVPSQIEPFGLVVLEALSLGKAIVASNTGGIREIVDGLGALVEPGDEEELAEAMEEACKGSLGEERERYVERAWEFDVSRIAPLLYDDILRNGSVDLGR